MPVIIEFGSVITAVNLKLNSDAARRATSVALLVSPADRFDPAHDHRDQDQEQGDPENVGQNAAIIGEHLHRIGNRSGENSRINNK
jgi:hypothetical protein